MPGDHLSLMASRPVFHAEIGVFLAHRRDAKGWTQRQAIDIAQRKGIALGLGPLRFLELGKTKHPDAELLKAVAALYGLSFEKLAQRFVEANYGLRIDLVRQDGDPSSGRPQDGGPLDDPVALGVELKELRDRVARYEKAAGKMRAATDDLFKLAVALEQISATTENKPSRRRRDRKVG